MRFSNEAYDNQINIKWRLDKDSLKTDRKVFIDNWKKKKKDR